MTALPYIGPSEAVSGVLVGLVLVAAGFTVAYLTGIIDLWITDFVEDE